MPQPDPPDLVRLTAVVSGYVQGVGFRYSTLAFAQTLRLVGFAENRPNGDVLVVVEGPREHCLAVLAWLRGERSRSVRRPGDVTSVTAQWGPADRSFRRFSVY